MACNLENSFVQEVSDKPRIGLRWIAVFTFTATYVVLFYTMNTFAVLIVAMINVSSHSNITDSRHSDSCDSVNLSNAGNLSSLSVNKHIPEGEYLWTMVDQGIVLGSYFWGFLFSKLLLSRIGERVGQRASISLGITVMGILAIFSPLCASISPYALSVNRLLTGICAGPITSNIPSLLSAWAPRKELSSMSTTMDSGVVIGNTIGFFSSGWMTYQFGWRSVFYFEGLLCFSVLPLWYIFIRNSPFDHPWLSNYEENILIENKVIKTKKRVPYGKIFRSRYLYLLIIFHFAHMWNEMIMILQGPSFFKYKLGFYLENASYIIGITNILSLVWIICCGRVSDLLINKKILSKTNTRKMFHMIATGGEALLYMCVSLTGCRFEVVVVLWIILYVLGTSTNASYRLNVIDIAPNFTVIASSFMGIGNLANAISPLVVSLLLEKGMGWNSVFYLTAAIEFLSCILYISLMTSKAQPWNFIENELEKELENELEKEQENGTKNKSLGKLIQ